MKQAQHKLYIISEHLQQYIPLIQNLNLPHLTITDSPKQANIALASPPMLAKNIKHYPQLEWVQSTYAGVNALIDDQLPQHYTLTNVKGIFGQQIAEYVLGYCITHFRHFKLYQEQQLQKNWQSYSYTTLSNKKMVILGTGSIASYLAQAANPFGITSFGVNTSGIPPQDNPFSAVYHIDELPNILTQADIVVSILPDTTSTTHLLNEKTLSACQSALLFNVGRGNVLEPQALLSALDNGNIQHAFLDVFVNEPLSQECPYWSHPDITVTPHIAAHSFPEQVIEIFKANYLSWLEGKPLSNVIDFAKGY